MFTKSVERSQFRNIKVATLKISNPDSVGIKNKNPWIFRTYRLDLAKDCNATRDQPRRASY